MTPMPDTPSEPESPKAGDWADPEQFVLYAAMLPLASTWLV
jgi:hypothetical protein